MTRPPLPAHVAQPHLSRLAPDAPGYDDIVARHASALARGELMYVDPASGLWVQTAHTLWERGTCCDKGCRHCPFLGPD